MGFVFHRNYILACLFIGITACSSAQYSSIILNPPANSGYLYSLGQGAANGLQVGYGGGTITGSRSNALLWRGTADSFVSLHPNGFDYSYAKSTDNVQQVGFAYTEAQRLDQAMLWTGSAASAVNLSPQGRSSQALGVHNGHQVGVVTGRAALWSGTAESYMSLHPFFGGVSVAYDVYNNQQAGYVSAPQTGGRDHAFLWNNSASSYVDLHPSGFSSSQAVGIDGSQQVGYASLSSGDDIFSHAFLWSGTKASAVDLHSARFTRTYAAATNGRQQVGSGVENLPNSATHALLWSGTADSVIDLHSFLPSNYVTSIAYGIAPDGTIIGQAALRFNGGIHAVMWKPVPEPESFLLVAGGALACFFKKRQAQ